MIHGIFGNIFGDYERLERTLEFLQRNKAESISVMGNLIVPPEQMIVDESCMDHMDHTSRKCIDMIAARYDAGLNLLAYKGQSELAWLRREHEAGREGELYKKVLFSTSTGAVDITMPKQGIRFVCDGCSQEPVADIDENYLAAARQIPRDSSLATVCFLGNKKEQRVYKMEGRSARRIYGMTVPLELLPGTTYVVSPSSSHGGSVLFDPKEAIVKLF